MNIRTYTDPSDFGCTYASTITEFYNSLPNDSIFMCDVYDLADSSWNFPNKYGTLIIYKKALSRMIFYFIGKNSNLGIQARFLDTKDGATVIDDTWYKIAHSGNINSLVGNMSNHLTTPIAQNIHTAWHNTGITTRFFAPNQMTNQPSSYGNLLSVVNGGEKSQLWFSLASGTIYHRQGNGRGWNGSQDTESANGWVEFLDKSNWRDVVYPVGSIYMSTSATSPASLFGGTWTQIKDRFLVSAGGSYGSGATGGSTQHSHGMTSGSANITVAGGYLYYQSTGKGFTANWWHGGMATGNNQAYGVNNGVAIQGNTSWEAHMPPYFTVYMWYRTA